MPDNYRDMYSLFTQTLIHSLSVQGSNPCSMSTMPFLNRRPHLQIFPGYSRIQAPSFSWAPEPRNLSYIVTRSGTEHSPNSGCSYSVVSLSLNSIQWRIRRGAESEFFSSPLIGKIQLNDLNELEYNAVLRETAKEVNRFQGNRRKINNPQ